MSNRQIVIPPTQYVSNLGAGEHGILFYTSKEEMRNIHFAFVKSGLENNQGVVYVAPGSYAEELRIEMQNYGIDTKRFIFFRSLFRVRRLFTYFSGIAYGHTSVNEPIVVWAVRFRDYAKKAHGVDFAGPLPPPNENIVDWQEEKQHLGP